MFISLIHAFTTVRPADEVSRVQDWIQGMRSAAPEKETRQALEKDPLYGAERLRIIYQLITNAPEDGGAGITPKHGEWKNVESIFALHDREYNKNWIKKWSTEWYLKPEDLDDIRNRLGEKVRFVFRFYDENVTNEIDRFLFRLYPVVFLLPDIPSGLWSLRLATVRPLLTDIRDCERRLVYSLHGVLEASREGSGNTLGRPQRLKH